jgi:hypothetical protein
MHFILTADVDVKSYFELRETGMRGRSNKGNRELESGTGEA